MHARSVSGYASSVSCVFGLVLLAAGYNLVSESVRREGKSMSLPRRLPSPEPEQALSALFEQPERIPLAVRCGAAAGQRPKRSDQGRICK